MRYRLLGRSGLRASELALGTMTFGADWGWGADRDESRKQFDAYAARGGNFIDTANRYTEGTSERLVGEFVKADRDHFVVATRYTLFDRKGDPFPHDFLAQDAMKDLRSGGTWQQIESHRQG